MFGFFKKKTAAPFTGEQCSVDISSGGMTINGETWWQQAVLRGEDCEVLRTLHVGGYCVTAEYADPFAGDNPDEGGYNCVEIQLGN